MAIETMRLSHVPILLLTILSLIIAFLSNDMYMPAMPNMLSVFNVNEGHIQQTMAMWFLGSMSPQLFVGPISDSFGRKPIIVFSMIGLIIGSFFCSITENFYIFMLGRYLQGFSSACVMVVAYVIVHESAATQKQATQNVSYVSISSSLATMLGPLIGSVICSIFGWRIVFSILTILSIICLILVFYCLHETNVSPRKFKPNILLREYFLLITNKKFMVVVFSYALMMFAGGILLSGIPFIIENVFHLNAMNTGYIMIPLLISYMIAAWLTNKISQKISVEKVIYISLLIATSAHFIFMFFAYFDYLNYIWTILFLSMYYFCFGLCGPHLNSIALQQAGADNLKGVASSLFSVIVMLFCSLGIYSYSYIKCDTNSFSISMLLPIALAYIMYAIFYRSNNANWFKSGNAY